MGKVKVKRSSTSIDMTPMVDLAFLLVTFFMLTTKFAPEEPMAVDMPSSVSEIKLPDITPDEVKSFSLMSSLGVPVGNLKQFLDMKPDERKLVKQPGIPCDSINNELADWIVFSRVTNPKLRIAIKGDRDANYPIVKSVITTLIDRKVNRFNLITNLEKGS